ncbi:hypothetical protein N7540_000228 [Penicillium herquei]|nr:hypothetical protein N7540_000228 [Penicillium herquei]
MSGEKCQNLHLRPNTQSLNIQAAREKRRLQNKIAQRKHRLKKAAQNGLKSQTLDSRQQNSLCESDATLSSDPTSSVGPRQEPWVREMEFSLEDLANIDPSFADEALFDIRASDEIDLGFFEETETDKIPDGASRPTTSSVGSEVSSIPLEPVGCALEHFERSLLSQQRQARRGLLAIHIASESGLTSIIEALLRNGADINLTDSQGWTALHYAVEGNHVGSIKTLLDWGANPLQVNFSGVNSLHLAVIKGYCSVACLLLDYGVDPNTAILGT